MDFYIGDKEEVLIETRDLMYFSETRLINIPRKIVMNFFRKTDLSVLFLLMCAG